VPPIHPPAPPIPNLLLPPSSQLSNVKQQVSLQFCPCVCVLCAPVLKRLCVRVSARNEARMLCLRGHAFPADFHTHTHTFSVLYTPTLMRTLPPTIMPRCTDGSSTPRAWRGRISKGALAHCGTYVCVNVLMSFLNDVCWLQTGRKDSHSHLLYFF